MGVYINMEMPESGSCIQIVIDDDGKVYPSVEKCIFQMGSIAKAVPVPPHGSLIEKHDVFKLITAFPEVDKLLPVEFMEAIYNLPTIIPASEEGET